MHVHSLNTIIIPTATLQSTPPALSLPQQAAPASQEQNGNDNTVPTHNPLNPGVNAQAHDPELAKLKARDREVRAHEAAHTAAAGSLTTGGPSFTYQRGSDGRLYAIGGEVNIDTSPVAGDPEATIQKARQIRAAANAPANPSAQDRAVAAQAARMEAQARRELQQERTEQLQEATDSPPSQTTSVPTPIDLFV